MKKKLMCGLSALLVLSMGMNNLSSIHANDEDAETVNEVVDQSAIDSNEDEVVNEEAHLDASIIHANYYCDGELIASKDIVNNGEDAYFLVESEVPEGYIYYSLGWTEENVFEVYMVEGYIEETTMVLHMLSWATQEEEDVKDIPLTIKHYADGSIQYDYNPWGYVPSGYQNYRYSFIGNGDTQDVKFINGHYEKNIYLCNPGDTTDVMAYYVNYTDSVVGKKVISLTLNEYACVDQQEIIETIPKGYSYGWDYSCNEDGSINISVSGQGVSEEVATVNFYKWLDDTLITSKEMNVSIMNGGYSVLFDTDECPSGYSGYIANPLKMENGKNIVDVYMYNYTDSKMMTIYYEEEMSGQTVGTKELEMSYQNGNDYSYLNQVASLYCPEGYRLSRASTNNGKIVAKVNKIYESENAQITFNFINWSTDEIVLSQTVDTQITKRETYFSSSEGYYSYLPKEYSNYMNHDAGSIKEDNGSYYQNIYVAQTGETRTIPVLFTDLKNYHEMINVEFPINAYAWNVLKANTPDGYVFNGMSYEQGDYNFIAFVKEGRTMDVSLTFRYYDWVTGNLITTSNGNMTVVRTNNETRYDFDKWSFYPHDKLSGYTQCESSDPYLEDGHFVIDSYIHDQKTKKDVTINYVYNKNVVYSTNASVTPRTLANTIEAKTPYGYVVKKYIRESNGVYTVKLTKGSVEKSTLTINYYSWLTGECIKTVEDADLEITHYPTSDSYIYDVMGIPNDYYTFQIKDPVLKNGKYEVDLCVYQSKDKKDVVLNYTFNNKLIHTANATVEPYRIRNAEILDLPKGYYIQDEQFDMDHTYTIILTDQPFDGSKSVSYVNPELNAAASNRSPAKGLDVSDGDGILVTKPYVRISTYDHEMIRGESQEVSARLACVENKNEVLLDNCTYTWTIEGDGSNYIKLIPNQEDPSKATVQLSKRADTYKGISFYCTINDGKEDYVAKYYVVIASEKYKLELGQLDQVNVVSSNQLSLYAFKPEIKHLFTNFNEYTQESIDLQNATLKVFAKNCTVYDENNNVIDSNTNEGINANQNFTIAYNPKLGDGNVKVVVDFNDNGIQSTSSSTVSFYNTGVTISGPVFDQESISLKEGECETLTVSVPNGSTDVEWAVSDDSILSIASDNVIRDGKARVTVTALKEGTASVTVKSEGEAACSVSVERVDKVEGYTLLASDDLLLNYHVFLSQDTIKDSETAMKFSSSSGKTQIVKLNQAYKTEYGYVFGYQLSAKELNDSITAQIITSKGVVYENTYSLYNYLTTIVNGNNYSDEVKGIATSLLGYGCMAQLYFGYNVNNLPDVIYKDETTPDLDEYEHSIYSTNDSIKFAGARLVLKTKLGMKLYFKGEGTFYVDGKNFVTTKEGEYTVITIHNIEDIYKMYTIKCDGFEMQYAVASFGKIALNSSNENLRDLIKSLVAYYNYF